MQKYSAHEKGSAELRFTNTTCSAAEYPASPCLRVYTGPDPIQFAAME